MTCSIRTNDFFAPTSLPLPSLKYLIYNYLLDNQFVSKHLPNMFFLCFLFTVSAVLAHVLDEYGSLLWIDGRSTPVNSNQSSRDRRPG